MFLTQLGRILFSNVISIVFNMAQGPFSSTFFIWPCVFAQFMVGKGTLVKTLILGTNQLL